MAVNAEYPEGWSIRVLRIVADGEVVVDRAGIGPVPRVARRVRAAGVTGPSARA